MTVGAKYDANSVYLAMMYAQTRNMTPYGDTGIADETQNFEAVAQYQFDFGLRPSLAWFTQRQGHDLSAMRVTHRASMATWIWLTISTSV